MAGLNGKAVAYAVCIKAEVKQCVEKLKKKKTSCASLQEEEEDQLRFFFWRAINAYGMLLLHSHDIFVHQRELLRCLYIKCPNGCGWTPSEEELKEFWGKMWQ